MTLARTGGFVPPPQPGSVNLAITAAVILLVFGLLGPLMSGGQTGPGGGGDSDGSTVRQLFYVISLVVAITASGPIADPKKLLVLPVSMTLLLAWCWLSLLWAFDVQVALKRLILTTMIIWSVFLIVQQLGLERTLKVLRIALVIMLILNIAVSILVPSLGVHQREDGEPMIIGSWRGVSGHKNIAGPLASFTIIYFSFYVRNISLAIRIPVLGASALLLWMSQSKTSMSILVLSLVFGFAYAIFDRKNRILILPLLLFLILLVLIFGQAQIAEFSEQFSRPDGLTGRTQIWPALWAFWQDHWLGAGFGSFWGVGNDSPIFTYARGWIVNIYSGHNGYLDLLVQVGPPGVFLAVLAVFLVPFWRLITSSVPSPSLGALLLASIVFPLGQNMSESTLLERDHIVQILLMFTVAAVGAATTPPKPAPFEVHAQAVSPGVRRPFTKYKRVAR